MCSEVDLDTAKSAALFKRLEEEFVAFNGDGAYVHSGKKDTNKSSPFTLLGETSILYC